MSGFEGLQWDPQLTVPWERLNAANHKRRLDISYQLMLVVRILRGYPRLSATEEGFLTGLEAKLCESHFHYGCSRKQWDWLMGIAKKVLLDESGGQ